MGENVEGLFGVEEDKRGWRRGALVIGSGADLVVPPSCFTLSTKGFDNSSTCY